MRFKTTICLILLMSVIVSVISPIPFGVANALTEEEKKDLIKETEEVEKNFYGGGETKSPCGKFGLAIWRRGCLLYIAADLILNIVYSTTNAITWIGGQVFNAAVFFSLSREAFDTKGNSMIFTGWDATRNLANLFFIFIILYIAIATILQISGYGSKAILVKVIVVALLINFSLLVTKVVIDASHALAWEFYNSIDVSKGGKFWAVNIEADSAIFREFREANKAEEVEKNEPFQKKNLAAVFMAGFNPQNITKVNENTREQLTGGKGVANTFWDMIFIYTLGSIINLIAAFILFAAGILFIIRVVVLWFVMIFAPLGFVGMILPGKMGGIAKTWWNKLFSQAFFAPAFLFLFYLVTVMVNSKFLNTMLNSANAEGITRLEGTLIVIFHFIIIGGLTIGCLVIAKWMGTTWSGMVISWGGKLQGAAQGYVGRGAKYFPQKWAGVAGEKVATGKGRIAGAMRTIPGAARLSAYAAAQNRAKIGEIQKGMEKYNNTELQNMLGKVTGKVMPFTRAAIVQELAKRKSLKETKPEFIKGAKGTMERYGTVTKDVDRLRPDLVKGNMNEYIKDLEKGRKELEIKYGDQWFDKLDNKGKEAHNALNFYKAGERDSAGRLQKMADEDAQNKVIKKFKTSDWEEVPDDVVLNDTTRKMIINNISAGGLNKFVERGGVVLDKIMEDLVNIEKKETDSYRKVSEALARRGNRSAAAWANSFNGYNVLDQYGMRKELWKNSTEIRKALRLEREKTRKK